MIVRFWGVRGSLPTPSIANLKYGGNTPCVEVRTNSGQLILLDAGTGVRALGQRLMRETPEGGHRIMLFLTHYHWDHIQGIPFFEPLYAPGNIVYMHGFRTSEASVDKVLGEQMANPFFPVDASVMRATRHLYTIGEETIQVGDAVMTTRFLNHPQGCLGYRIEADGHTIVYATDNEHGSPAHDKNVRELCAGADFVIFDTQYTAAEYETRHGWGHSTWEVGVNVCRDAGAKGLVLFHHDPDHGDAMLDEMVLLARERFPSTIAAFEGMELDPSTPLADSHTAFDKRYLPRRETSMPLVGCIRLGTTSVTARIQNISLDGIYVLVPSPIQPGEEIDIELRSAGGGHELVRAKARVVRCEQVGAQFGLGLTLR